MQNEHLLSQSSSPFGLRLNVPRNLILGLILAIALFAFELFNFDTTRFALRYLLGDVSFLGMGWATVLAVAFCAIDFAGLARLFTPEQGADEPRTVWYLMGAWLLGATMNALMTWWAVSLTLLSHEFGNEVLSRQQLLQMVPVFVAALVWLTRILFIGALSVAGDQLFRRQQPEVSQYRRAQAQTTARSSAATHLKIARGPKEGTAAGMRRPGSVAPNRSRPAARRGEPRFPVPRTAVRAPAGMQARRYRR